MSDKITEFKAVMNPGANASGHPDKDMLDLLNEGLINSGYLVRTDDGMLLPTDKMPKAEPGKLGAMDVFSGPDGKPYVRFVSGDELEETLRDAGLGEDED